MSHRNRPGTRTRRSDTTCAARWYGHARIRAHDLPEPLRAWLLDTRSLTRRLRRACGAAVRVQVLEQRWMRPRAEEAARLHNRPGARCLVRHSLLLCRGEPWVFARTVIPAHTLAHKRILGHLGERPLGSVLFADKHLERERIEIARLPRAHWLTQTALVTLEHGPACLWARRSVFRIGRDPLLVSELFLPAVSGAPAPLIRGGEGR